MAGADGAKAVHLKSGQNPAYSQVSEPSRAQQESGKTDPAQEMKRTLAEDGEEDDGEKIQKALNKSMKPVLRSPVAPGMMLDGQLGDAIAPGVGHHGDEAVQLSVQRQLFDDLGAKALEAAIVVAQLETRQAADQPIEHAAGPHFVPGVLPHSLPTIDDVKPFRQLGEELGK